nr:hypothetical protein CFP56_36366 [Quercus suber]
MRDMPGLHKPGYGWITKEVSRIRLYYNNLLGSRSPVFSTAPARCSDDELPEAGIADHVLSVPLASIESWRYATDPVTSGII